MSYQWADTEYAQLPDWVQKARFVLEDWFWAMEDGTVKDRLPDPFDRSISQDVADKIVKTLDEEVGRELSWAGTPTGGNYTAGPGFDRLAPEQRIALAQTLHKILSVHDLTKETVHWEGI